MWLRPIVNKTLQQRVSDALPSSHVHATRFSAFSLEENLSETSRLLDQAVALRDQIIAVEAEAINRAIDFALAEGISERAATIAKTQVRAYRSQIAETAQDASPTTVDEIALLTNAGRELKLSLHNQVGGSLNFGERVHFLTSIYIDAVRVLYQRAVALRRGLAAIWSIPLSPLPAWNPVEDSLAKLIFWLRTASEECGYLRQEIQIETVFIPLRRDSEFSIPD